MKVTFVALIIYVASGLYFFIWAAKQKRAWRLIEQYPYRVRVGMLLRHSDQWLGRLRQEHREEIRVFATGLRWRYYMFFVIFTALLFLIMWAESTYRF
jgi:hypothetical protein